LTELPCFTAHGVHFDIYSEGSKGSFSRPRSGSKTEKLFSILRTYNGKERRQTKWSMTLKVRLKTHWKSRYSHSIWGTQRERVPDRGSSDSECSLPWVCPVVDCRQRVTDATSIICFVSVHAQCCSKSKACGKGMASKPRPKPGMKLLPWRTRPDQGPFLCMVSVLVNY